MDDEELPDVVREAPEVARRCCVLIGIVAAGHREPRPPIVDWLKQEELWENVSPREQSFLLDESPTPQQFVDASWRAEALHALLWSLYALPVIREATEICSLQQERDATPYLQPTSDFIAAASLRPGEEIHAALDMIYHTHWRIRDAELRGSAVPDGLDRGVISERHHALNWVTGYCGQKWDDITTDT